MEMEKLMKAFCPRALTKLLLTKACAICFTQDLLQRQKKQARPTLAQQPNPLDLEVSMEVTASPPWLQPL